MYVSIWLSAIAVALVAAWTIAFALPMSAEEELNRAAVSEALLDVDLPALPNWLASSTNALAVSFCGQQRVRH
ncbi:hypothetical protein AWB81_00340 [Caballeronia arationis]|jgi:hypothetical protein|uniref:Uncharacterized protein n=1 Tax=Caballeronia arationis TaxID=1777142 RepID=A0A7Z7N655_9BURK|nr:hypothetical protein [Caballeronia arationis]SAK44977.1 hypothetical protein AWB81_00340 [Caballeronia arationis]SOE88450.1 hypothetical protein SAMN05446927_7064 [Caballeronia arationis]